MSTGCRIILKGFGDAASMQRVSFLDPDAIFVDVRGQKAFARRGHVVALPPDIRKCLLFMLCSPCGCTSAELIDLLWADRPDGGPEYAIPQIRGYVAAVALAAAALGFAIDKSAKGGRWRVRQVA